MRKKSPDYSNQWNLDRTQSRQEMKACLLYENARESEVILGWVDQHRKSPSSTDDFGGTPLSYIQNVSVPLARMVEAMGRRTSLSPSWYELKPSFRRVLAEAAYPSIRYAERNELMESLREYPQWKSHRQYRGSGPVEEDSISGRILCVIVDASCPAAALAEEFKAFALRSIAAERGGHRGRGGTGLEVLKSQLRNLGLLRLLSTRDLPEARLAIQSEDSALLGAKSGGEGGVSNRIRGAQATFRKLFPNLFNGESPQMISYACYKMKHPAGRPSVNRSALKKDKKQKGGRKAPTDSVYRKFTRLMENRGK